MCQLGPAVEKYLVVGFKKCLEGWEFRPVMEPLLENAKALWSVLST